MGDFLKRHTTACIVAFFIVLFGACGFYMWQTLKPQPPAEIGQIEAPAGNEDTTNTTDNNQTSNEPVNANWKQLVSDYNGRDNLVVTKDDKIIGTDPAVESKFVEGMKAISVRTHRLLQISISSVTHRLLHRFASMLELVPTSRFLILLCTIPPMKKPHHCASLQRFTAKSLAIPCMLTDITTPRLNNLRFLT